MNISKNTHILLRIYLAESDKYEKKPLHEVILDLALQEKIAGATVLKGCAGYGATAHLHTSKILILSEDLPMVIEIIDTKEKIDQLLTKLKPMLKTTKATLQNVDLIIM
jgi:uncharacterized protein